VEFASNLVWVVVAICLLGMTYLGARRRSAPLPMASAMTLTVLVCFILLPAISISDDLLAAKQAALPQSAQTWRMASEDASVGLEIVTAVVAYLLLMICFRANLGSSRRDVWDLRPFAGRLARCLRLRPPPCAA
jgi:FtsH-binding integral membrane protein